jgi:hypothetical protein
MVPDESSSKAWAEIKVRKESAKKATPHMQTF